MKRLDVIDGMRGYFLVFMLINHLVFAGGYWLVEINHRQFTFVEDAQGFVFLSGLLIGMVYARRMLKEGYAAGRDKIWARAFELYRYAMALVFVIFVARMILPDAPQIWANWLGERGFNDPLRMGSIATFLFQPTYMDILPQYIVYMVFAPALVWLCVTDRWMIVAIGSLIVWMAGQLGLHRGLTFPVDALLGGGPEQEGMRASFNLLGWQIVFFSGLIAGALTSVNKVKWTEVFSPEKTFIPLTALAICLFFLPLRIATAHGFMPDFMLQKFATMEVRADFGPVYLLNFAAVAAGLAWLLIAGPRHKNVYVQRVSAFLTGLFTLSYLRLLGRHSLQVYVWHVIIVFAVYYVDGHTPEMSQLTKTAIAFVSIALLSLPAIYRERDSFGEPQRVPVAAKKAAGSMPR